MRLHTPPDTHRARILRFADADTAVILIEGMWGVWTERYLRLEGIESWELNSSDRAKAISARDELNRLLANRDVLVHLRSHGHDRFGRLNGHITVGESDLATRIVELKLAWFCSKAASIEGHRVSTTVAVAAALVTSGCYIARDASTLVVQNGARGSGTTNGTMQAAQTVTASPHQSAQLPTHALLYAAAAIAVVAIVAAVIWVVHNRGKLIGQLAALATKV